MIREHCNLWEWCSDWHGEYPSREFIDPKGPIRGQREKPPRWKLRGG